MEVEVVNLVGGDAVDDLLYGVHAEEGAGYIEHITAVGKAGLVGDGAGGEEAAAVGVGAEVGYLFEGFGAVK